MPVAPPGYVRLRCSDPKFDQTFLLGEDPPKVSGGVGGWETVQRPRQVSMTIWQGTDPFELELVVMLDGWEPGVAGGGYSQEPALRALLAAARGDDESEPSTWDIDGIPWLPADEWVLNSVEPGDTVLRRSSDFSRVRQDLTLAFVEYIPPEYLQLRAKARQGAKSKTTVYTVKKGDTPASIARKRRCKWTEIRDLNKDVITKGAKQALRVGSRLRVPVLRKPARKKRTSSTKK
jgi:nucleoid-associated protein YgaU